MLTVVECPSKTAAEVVVLCLEPNYPCALLSLLELGVRTFGQLKVMQRMLALGRLGCAPLLEPLSREFSNCFQHGVTWFRAGVLLGAKKALVNQRRQRLEFRLAYFLRRVQLAPTAENAEVCKLALLRFGEQLIAPFDRRSQSSLAFRGVTCPSDQKWQP